MARFKMSDLKEEVSRLNEKYKKTNKTYVKFGLLQAYGGNQIVLKSNRAGGVVTSITSGYETPTGAMEKLFKRSDSSIKNEMDSFHKYVASYRKRVRNKSGKMA